MLVTGGFHRPSVRPRCRGNRLAAAAALTPGAGCGSSFARQQEPRTVVREHRPVGRNALHPHPFRGQFALVQLVHVDHHEAILRVGGDHVEVQAQLRNLRPGGGGGILVQRHARLGAAPYVAAQAGGRGLLGGSIVGRILLIRGARGVAGAGGGAGGRHGGGGPGALPGGGAATVTGAAAGGTAGAGAGGATLTRGALAAAAPLPGGTP